MRILTTKCMRYLLVGIGLLLLFGCVQEETVQPVARKPIDPIRDIYVKLVNNSFNDRALNLEAKNLIHTKLIEIKSNYDDPWFSAYIESGLRGHMKENRLFTLQPSHNGMYDLQYEIHAIKSSPQHINILMNIINPRNDYIFYSNQAEYPLADFNMDKYSNFKNLYKDKLKRQILASKNAHVAFKADIKGGAYKEKNQHVFMMNLFNAYDVEVDTGYGGYYPTDMTLTINRKKYEPGKDNVFYEGDFAPGQILCKASFRGARWDNVAKRETIITETFTKRFMLNVKEKEKLQVNVAYFYDGHDPNIHVKVSKLKTVIQQGVKSNKYEVIQQF